MNTNFDRFGLRYGVTVVGWVLIFVLVIVVIGVGAGMMQWMMNNPVEAEKVEKEVLVPSVEVVTLRVEDYGVRMGTQGEVGPVTETTVVSELNGSLVGGADSEVRFSKLKAGGEFAANETMVILGKGDYEAALADAKAALSDAELAEVQEKARAVQARRDWSKLGRGGEPSDLVLRIPQLKSARARVEAAEEMVSKRLRDLGKTEIKAPYACKISKAYVAKGGYVLAGGRVADIYASDAVELRLPLSLEDVGFLPEELLGTVVDVEAFIGNRRITWRGEVVRTEGEVDRETLTMMTVVRLEAKEDGGMFALPPVGLFVKGEFVGQKLNDVVRLPRKALHGEDKVWVLGEGEKLEIRKVKVERTERDFVIVSEGLGDLAKSKEGVEVIVSPIELAVEGMQLKVVRKGGAE